MRRLLAIAFFVALLGTVALAQSGGPKTGAPQTETDANIKLPVPPLGFPQPVEIVQNGGALLKLPPVIPPVKQDASQFRQLSIIDFINLKTAELNDLLRAAPGPEFRIIDGTAYLCSPGLGYCVPMVGGGKSGCIPGQHLNSIAH